MRLRMPEPKGKLDAMTGYSFTTPVWEGGRWVTPAVAGVTAAARIVNGPEDEALTLGPDTGGRTRTTYGGYGSGSSRRRRDRTGQGQVPAGADAAEPG